MSPNTILRIRIMKSQTTRRITRRKSEEGSNSKVHANFLLNSRSYSIPDLKRSTSAEADIDFSPSDYEFKFIYSSSTTASSNQVSMLASWISKLAMENIMTAVLVLNRLDQSSYVDVLSSYVDVEQ